MGVKWEGERVKREAEAAVEGALDRLVISMVAECKKRMKSGPQTGRDYRGWRFMRSKSGKLMAWEVGDPGKGKGRYKTAYVRSSAPGEYPAVQSGDLWRSINWARAGKGKRLFGTGSKHGAYLEVGAPKAGIKPRPFLRMTYRKFMGKDAEVHFAGKMK